jgi:hypothetical protein
MATGDITLSVAIEGGVTKTVTIASDVRVLAKAQIAPEQLDSDLTDDANYAIFLVNKLARQVASDANVRQEVVAAAALTAKTFTAAS